MASYSGNTASKVIVSNIPSNYSKAKLRTKLEEASGGRVLGLDYITKTSVKVTFSDETAQQQLLLSGISIQFGSQKYQLEVKRVGGSSTECERRTSLLSEEPWTYVPSDTNSKAILRYISHTSEPRNALKSSLRERQIELSSIRDDKIEMTALKSGITSNYCEKSIEEFFELYSSWTEKLEDCSNDDKTDIIRILAKYKNKCFGNLYSESDTVLVTGPKSIVETVKSMILKTVNESKVEKEESPARSFSFTNIDPAVMRFVSRSKRHKAELVNYMQTIAYVEIKAENKILGVQITPNHRTAGFLHSQFENECKRKVEGFFSKFHSRKEEFDINLVKSHESVKPEFFKEQSGPDFYMKWFVDSGKVNVCGIKSEVEMHWQRIVTLLGMPNTPSSQRSRHHSMTSQPDEMPLGNHAVTHAPRSTTPNERSRHISSSSDDASPRHMPAMYKKPFPIEDIPKAVRLFVLKELEIKKKFEKCCEPIAKVVIRSDKKESISVVVNFSQQNYTSQNEQDAFQRIQDFFDKFDTQTKKYDKTKLENLKKDANEILSGIPGELHILTFPESGTVKITGITEKILAKHQEIQSELNAITQDENIPIDIFIAQRECGVWSKVEERCKSTGLRVSIVPKQPGKIQYRGNRKAILKAQQFMGKISESLTEQPIEGFSAEAECFLRKCEKFQKEYPTTKKNVLDAVYECFKEKSSHGSLIFHDHCISLITSSKSQWTKINGILQKFITDFYVSISDAMPLAKMFKTIKAKLLDEAVYVVEMPGEKKLHVYCFQTQVNGMKRKINEIIQEAGDGGDIEKFYPMPKPKAKHIKNPQSQCKLYKAKTVEIEQRRGQWGLVITCEKEDLDTVDMKFEDLKDEIVHEKRSIPGYGLHESLTKAEILAIEHSTKCSIFLEATGKAQTRDSISVIQGNILDQDCDAIVNSTGKGLSFTSSSQVNKALSKKYGSDVLKHISKQMYPLLLNQAALYETNGWLRWKYIINVCTPNNRDSLKKFISDLLSAADKFGIQSLALPTVGTGNMGMDPNAVAECMKEAFHSFNSNNSAKNLKDVRLVVFDLHLLPIFKRVVPKQESVSNGVKATIYANSKDELRKAFEELNKLCKSSVTEEIINNPAMSEISSFVKNRVKDICQQHVVNLQWKTVGVTEQCIIRGASEKVRKAKEEIKKLLDDGIPQDWSPMSETEVYKRVKLDPSDDEYIDVENKFKKSSPTYSRIHQIERIQNPLRYRQFKDRKNSKVGRNPSRPVSRYLFHGTSPDKVKPICEEGFDRNYAGENGTAYGQGVYFHVNSSYSVKYSGARYSVFSVEKCVFLAEVITGDYVQGSSAYKSAPKKGTNGERYDSVVDNVLDPQIFVVFPDSSSYPRYLITFS